MATRNNCKTPKEIGDVVINQSMHPTNDSWYPSFDRGHYNRPETFEECECWECQMIPAAKRQEHYRWDWEEGGRVACFFWAYDAPHYFTRNPKPNDDFYMARVSFWGCDDTGMEKYFRYEEDARRFVCHLPPYISKEFLWDHGFVGC